MGQLASGAFDGSGTGTFPGGGQMRSLISVYDFAVNGGAEGAIAIGKVPAGSRIRGGFMDVTAAVTGAGASVAVHVEAANDIQTAAGIVGAPWSSTGKKAITPKANTPESSSILTTVDRDVTVTISGAAVTAGRFVVYLDIQNVA